MDGLQNQVITLLFGGVLGGILKHIFDSLKARRDYRFDSFAELNKIRWEAYRELWSISKLIPRWPRKEKVTLAELESTSVQLRDWYYDGGGILLTERAKSKYLKIQAELTKSIKDGEAKGSVEIDFDTYDYLHKVFSELRTELTIDLMSRETYKS